ncbi:MAG: ABC transporter permease [Wenzhouxiangellaceae bacterium]|nr:ABC transporter permease [Wenzhouxiangellaceae bacterium]
MLAYTLQRLLATIPVMAVVAIVVFSLLYLAPGDPAVVLAGEQATSEEIAYIRESLGLDDPYPVRLVRWIGDVLSGDLGTSVFSNRPVTTLIAQRLEPTVALTLAALVIAVALAVPLGVLAAWQAGKRIDRIVMGLAVLGFSVPVFVLGYLLIMLFSVGLEWLPVQGYRPIARGVGPFLTHLILPALSLGLVNAALIARITRATMIDVLGQDYIRTARAKGLSTSAVLLRHGLRNAAVPIVTIIGISFALLISGVVVTETVFNIPGLGRLTVDAILRRDYPVIQGLILVFSGVYVLVNLLVDLSYAWLDPRVRPGS